MIDRIVDGKTAVLLLGDEQAEYLCPVEKLPPGSGEGSWLIVRIKGEELLGAVLDPEKTREMKKTIRAKLALLRRRMLSRE